MIRVVEAIYEGEMLRPLEED
ncbi:MAG: hypothetical protein DRJ98_07550 [Thermoprotei archaeon]|nr:MAG: hypothetical protein DRJ98_07550 [Thermoprotei archaeon]